MLTLAFLAIGVALYAVLALLVSVTTRRGLERALEQRGRSYASDLAGRVELAAATGDTFNLDASYFSLARNDGELEYMDITTADGRSRYFVPGGAWNDPTTRDVDPRTHPTFTLATGQPAGGLGEPLPGKQAAVPEADPARISQVRVVMDSGRIQQQSRLAMLLMIGLVFGLGSIGLRYGFRRLIDPVLNLARAADRVGRGDFGVRVPVSAPAELGELETSFNDMVRALARHQEQSLSSRNAELAESLQRTQSLYDELKRTQETMVRAEKLRAVGEMASGVAHDFNNMLTAILGRTQLAQMKLQNGSIDRDRLLADMQVILQAAEDGSRAVQRLQQYTRGELKADLEPVELHEVVRQALEMTRPRWQPADAPDRPPVEALNDVPCGAIAAASYSDLREVLVNLINNAVDAMPAGGRLSISSRPAGERYQLFVRDTGAGMDEETQRRVFDPFFTTKGLQGTGLGLSIARGIIKRLGGRIELESKPGQGTCFTLELGRCAEDAAAAPPAAAPLSPERIAFPQREILIVDDNATALENLRLILEHLGQRVTAVDTGQGAIDLLQVGRFDLVISDLGMPEVTGWDVVQAAGLLPEAPPVVLCTGWGHEIDHEDARIAGVWRVLSKPYLMSQVEELMLAVGAEAGERKAA